MNIDACTKHITDPRKAKNRYYRLDSLIFLTFSAVISGYDTTESIVEFGRLKLSWLQKHVELPRIPCRETIRFLLASLNPNELIKGFEAFVSDNAASGDCISIDGKTMRGTSNSLADALHVVSAWSSELGLTLCALESEGKKNEIKTIPKLIEKINIKGAIVSLDAMGCQRDIASAIVAAGGDYMMQIKGNQNALFEEAKAYETMLQKTDFKGIDHDSFEELGKEHGRLETRKYLQFGIMKDWVTSQSKWPGAQSIVKVTRTREVLGKESEETSWYLSSLSVNGALAAKSIRSHWQCENNLHWRLDVIFREDELRSNNCAFAMATIKRFCMNLIKVNDTSKRYMKHKVMACAIDDDFRSKIMLSA